MSNQLIDVQVSRTSNATQVAEQIEHTSHHLKATSVNAQDGLEALYSDLKDAEELRNFFLTGFIEAQRTVTEIRAVGDALAHAKLTADDCLKHIASLYVPADQYVKPFGGLFNA